jgi:AraC-like DNA-binding protein
MRLEKIYNRPLEEDERILKAGYLADETRELWETPLSFSDYEKYREEGRITESPRSYLYKERSLGKLGTTVDDTGIPKVMITVHRRYSYPVLHNHDFVEIVYVASGRCLNLFEDLSLHMKTGDLCILSPNSYHALSCTNDESCIINFMVSKRFLDQNFMDTLAAGKVTSGFFEDILYRRSSCPYILFPTGSDPWLQELAQRILTELSCRKRAYQYSVTLLASEFLLHLTREYETAAVVPGKKNFAPNNLIVTVLSYLSANYNRTSLEDIASFFGYTREHMSRTIHENTGKTFQKLINELQIEHAAELLREGELTFTEIAQEIGCFDSSHFSKKFKSLVGLTPRQFQVLPPERQEKVLNNLPE